MLVEEVLRSTEAALAEAGCLSSRGEAELAIRRLSIAGPGVPGARLSGAEVRSIQEYVERRRSGDPPQYILGGCEFMGRWVSLDHTTYIPRPWTESMVRHGIAALGRTRRPRTVVDVGTGSGALALVIAESVRDCVVWALDVDERAVGWARTNTSRLSNVRVARSDLFGELSPDLAGQVDLVLGSLPYVPSTELGTLPRDYREHEPVVALDGGTDGLALYRRALDEARPWLRGRGRVLFELGHRQGHPLVAAARRLGYEGAQVHLDEEGDDLFLECRL